MNYRLINNKMKRKWQVINLTSLSIVREFQNQELAFAYLTMVNNPNRGIK